MKGCEIGKLIKICVAILLLSTGYAQATWTTIDPPGSSLTYLVDIDGTNLVGIYYGPGNGFLYDGNGGWRLSPAYDLNPVPMEEKARELTTWISEQGPDASLDLARDAAKYFAVKNIEVEAIIKRQKAVVADWRNTAKRLGMSAADTAAYASAFSASGRH